MSKAKCLNCKQIIHSKYRHDFVTCKCRRKSDEMNHRFRKKLEEYVNDGLQMSENHIHLACCAFEEVMGTGILLDGGDIYCRYGGKLEHYQEVED